MSVFFQISQILRFLGHIHINHELTCCSDVSTIVSSNQSSVFYIFISVTDLYSHDGDQTKDEDNPLAKYPDRTEKFLTDVKLALETLEDEVGSLFEQTRSGAYKNFLQSYQDALIPLWNPAHFASIKMVLEMVANPQMTDLAVMARRLQPTNPSTTIVKEKR